MGNTEYNGDWMVGQELEGKRAMTDDERADYEYFKRLDQMQDENGVINFQEEAPVTSGLYGQGDKSVTNRVDKLAKADQIIQGQKDTQVKNELGAVYDRFRGMLTDKQNEANYYKDIAVGLSGARFNV